MNMLQSNIHYYVRIKGYIVHAQEFCLHKILVHAQGSCACTTLLGMQNTLVHALEGPGTKAGTQQKALGVRPGPAFVLGPGLGPWPLQCMHKRVVHAQECCACTRILCMHKNLGPKNRPLLLGRCAASGGFFSEKKRCLNKE